MHPYLPYLHLSKCTNSFSSVPRDTSFSQPGIVAASCSLVPAHSTTLLPPPNHKTCVCHLRVAHRPHLIAGEQPSVTNFKFSLSFPLDTASVGEHCVHSLLLQGAQDYCAPPWLVHLFFRWLVAVRPAPPLALVITSLSTAWLESHLILVLRCWATRKPSGALDVWRPTPNCLPCQNPLHHRHHRWEPLPSRRLASSMRPRHRLIARCVHLATGVLTQRMSSRLVHQLATGRCATTPVMSTATAPSSCWHAIDTGQQGHFEHEPGRTGRGQTNLGPASGAGQRAQHAKGCGLFSAQWLLIPFTNSVLCY
jgi:hypothetical protein